MLLLRRLSFLVSSSSVRFAGSKHLLKPTRLYHVFYGKPVFRTHPVFCPKTNGLSYRSVHYEEHEPEENGVLPTAMTVLNKKLQEAGIDLNASSPGQYNGLFCPTCNGGSSMEKSLSLFIEEDWRFACWMCFRAKCGWKGYTGNPAVCKPSTARPNQVAPKPKKIIREISGESIGLEPLNDELLTYFAVRSISKETLERNSVMQRRNSDGQVDIAFTYRRKGKLVSCKYRSVTKLFWQVLGEMDKLSMAEAGFHNCVSVPDGAPLSVSQEDVPPEDKDRKYQYLWNCKECLKKASRLILATDGNAPGNALAEELARRIGRERCWRVQWPMKNKTEHFKDANEVLMLLGPDALKEVIDCAKFYPIPGLFNLKDSFDEIDAYYHQTHGCEFRISTGWKALNTLYNVVPGELTIVTGVPNSGKSEWIDALLCNLNEIAGWKFAICSMENKVREHARKLLEKHLKKPFFDERYGESLERMSVEELEQGKQWLSDTFSFIRTETEYVSQMLKKVKQFAQHHACHVWVVAHSRQLHQWDGGPPNLYDISGGANFMDKCDNGIVIHRNRDPKVGPIDLVQVCVRKVRNKVVGTIGEAFLSYDRSTGLYRDIQG